MSKFSPREQHASRYRRAFFLRVCSACSTSVWRQHAIDLLPELQPLDPTQAASIGIRRSLSASVGSKCCYCSLLLPNLCAALRVPSRSRVIDRLESSPPVCRQKHKPQNVMAKRKSESNVCGSKLTFSPTSPVPAPTSRTFACRPGWYLSRVFLTIIGPLYLSSV